MNNRLKLLEELMKELNTPERLAWLKKEQEELEATLAKFTDLKFVQTCGACPEQYDVFKGEEQVGYVRLRWGHMAVTAPNYDGELVYEHFFRDGIQGFFDSPEEREFYLAKANEAILRWLYKKEAA